MSCTDTVCGTGGWVGPLPGDPDNNSILTATAAYGGIDVTWTYPTLNAHAVNHTLLFRGVTPDFSLAVQQAVVSGNFYYDRIQKKDIQPYYYWIRIVSVNGTVGELIGPASASPKGMIEEVMQDLTGLIDSGVLAESLRSEIDRIEVLNQRIYTEEADRKEAITYVTQALEDVQSNGEEVAAYLQQETTLRISDTASLAQAINTAQSVMGDSIASVQTTLQTNIETVEGEVTQIGALYTAKVDVNGLVGGFGVYNNGTTVEAGFDVDRFWVGRTTNKRKPFIIENNVVYIDEGAINKLTFSKLRDESGSFVVENGKVKANYIDAANLNVRGQVNVGAFTSYAWPAAGLGGAHLSSSGFAIGNATNGGKYFHIASGYGTGGNAVITTNIPAHLEDLQVTNAKLANLSVGTAKIQNLAVNSLQIANNSVTVAASASASWGSKTANIETLMASCVLNFDVNAPSQTVLVFVRVHHYGYKDQPTTYTIKRDSTPLASFVLEGTSQDPELYYSDFAFDTAVLTGTHTYALYCVATGASVSNSADILALGRLK